MRKKKVRKDSVRIVAAALVVVFCAAVTVQATEYYISPTGNDAGSGTLFSPWQSPSRGAALRAQAAAASQTYIDVGDAEGFLPSGNLRLTVGTAVQTIAYTSRTENSFNLAAPLSGAVANDTVMQDADILGGVGFQGGDVITFRGGTWTNQRLRLKNGGTSGNPITYRGMPGEDAYLQWINDTVAGVPAWYGVYTDNNGEQVQKIENITFENMRLKNDQNGAGNEAGSVFALGALNNSIFRDLDVTATGSAGDAGMAFRTTKCVNMEIYDSVLWSSFSHAIYFRYGYDLNIHHTVIGGTKYGITNNDGASVTADHLTLIDIPNLAVHFEESEWEGTSGPVRSSLTNSILYYNDSSGVLNTLNKGSGDYNNIYNSADPYSNVVPPTDFHWNASTTHGTDGVPGANDYYTDPGFIISEFNKTDPNRFDPTWLRFLASSPAATASDTGSWIGAFAPIVAGDVNGDGFVGGTDLTIIGNNWGMVDADRDDGDLSGDGTVSGLDWTEVVTNWGGGVLPPEPAGVPEPGTLFLLLGGGLASLFGVRRAKAKTLSVVLALLLVGLLAMPAAAEISYSVVDVTGANTPAHYRSFDIMATVTTNMATNEMTVHADMANSIYIDALHSGSHTEPNPAFFPTFPSLEYDSYVTLGAWDTSVFIAGGAVDIEPTPTSVQFDNKDVSISWAAPGGYESGAGSFQVARVTLANRSSAALSVLGFETGQTVSTTLSGVIPTAIGVPEVTFTKNEGAGVPIGYAAYDIMASVDSNLGIMELLVDTDTAGDIYQNATTPDDPNETMASFVTMGPTGPDATNTALIKGAVDLGGSGSAYTFDTQNIDIAWMPDQGTQTDFGDFLIGRLVLKNNATGTYSLGVWQGEDPENPYILLNRPLSDFLPLPGDVNGDGWVGGLDLTLVITNWGKNPATREQGDLSGDGTVAGADYTEVITYWGTGTPLPPEPGIIPEPATLGLLLAGALAGLIRRR